MLQSFYIVLLVAGLIGFAGHLVAQFRMARILRRRYPDQWDIVCAPKAEGRRKLKTYARMQRVLRSNVPELFNDTQLTQWHRWWRYGPWVAWPCWIGALAMRVYVAG